MSQYEKQNKCWPFTSLALLPHPSPKKSPLKWGLTNGLRTKIETQAKKAEGKLDPLKVKEKQ